MIEEEGELIGVADFIRITLYNVAMLMCRNTDRIFKADLWNESHEGEMPSILPGKVYSVEFSWLRTEKAICPPNQTKLCGNVRALPFKSGVFDIVLDLSTIDHTCGPEHAIREYARILKPGGKALVASWVGQSTVHVLSDTALDQFLHDKDLMTQYMNKYFKDVRGIVLLNDKASRQLWTGLPEGQMVQMVSWVGIKE